MQIAATLYGISMMLWLGATNIQAHGSPDFDGNGKVEFADFLIFATGFGKQTGEELNL